MKKVFILFTVIAVAGIGSYFYYQNFLKPKEVHFHAGFKVYTDGKLQDFSDLKYMKIEPCTTEDVHVDEDEQMEKAHLHGFVGDVVHVHRDNAVWGDLFENIKFKVDESKPITAYINGKKINNILNYKIIPYDSLVLIIGESGNVSNYLKTAVKKDHILKVEKMSETCGSGS